MKPTEITVSFRRSRQPQQHESAEASVRLTLIAEDGEVVEDLDDAIADALDLVQAHVYDRLGLVTQQSKRIEEKAEAPAKEAAPGEPKRPRGRPKKEAAAPAQEQTPAEPAQEPAAAPVQEPTPAVQPGLPNVSDGDLVKAIGKIMQRLGSAAGPRVTEKIKAYLPDGNPPFSQNRIPQTARHDFLRDLEELK